MAQILERTDKPVGEMHSKSTEFMNCPTIHSLKNNPQLFNIIVIIIVLTRFPEILCTLRNVKKYRIGLLHTNVRIYDTTFASKISKRTCLLKYLYKRVSRRICKTYLDTIIIHSLIIIIRPFHRSYSALPLKQIHH